MYIKSELSDLEDKIKEISEDEKEIKQPDKILKIVQEIIKFNKQNQSGKRVKILAPNQMLRRLPITLAQLKAGNNSEKLKNEIRQLLYSLYRSKKLTKQLYKSLETIFMNTENSKTSEPHRFKLDLTDKLNLKNPNKNMALANLSIYYTWKNINSEYNNNKFKVLAPAWNDTFDLPDGSYSFLIFRIILNLEKHFDL